jgi:SUF system NifU family Fe-S assembly protein
MSDLTDLYQQVILDHNRRPRNRGKLPTANRVAHGDNPTCGDQCSVYLRLEGDKIADISFDGSGCAISQASASLMTTRLKGKTAAEAEALVQGFPPYRHDRRGARGDQRRGGVRRRARLPRAHQVRHARLARRPQRPAQRSHPCHHRDLPIDPVPP